MYHRKPKKYLLKFVIFVWVELLKTQNAINGKTRKKKKKKNKKKNNNLKQKKILMSCQNMFRLFLLGVDVFYVVSGFVITSILLAEAAIENKINFVRFYARRARRLVPASVVVLIVTALVTRIEMDFPRIFRGRSIFVAASLYFCNWELLWRDLDYFAPKEK
jgi:hypothetical protein